VCFKPQIEHVLQSIELEREPYELEVKTELRRHEEKCSQNAAEGWGGRDVGCQSGIANFKKKV
jgi:hypothetical protein